MSKTEEWKSVVGFDGFYEVSSFGRVKSLYSRGKRGPDNCLKQYISRNYPTVRLWKNGQATNMRVHRIVLEAFIGLRPTGCMAGHYNGNRVDAQLSNLRWITPEQNELDKVRHGTQLAGERHHQAKVTNQQAIEISQSSLPTRFLVRQYGLSRSQIQRIRNGAYWNGITQCLA